MKKFVLLAVFFIAFNVPHFAQELSIGKFSGQVFADYFYNISRDANFSNFDNTALEGSKDFNGFVLRRAALNYDQNISEKFSARFRLEADSKSNTSNSKIGVFVKDASLKWKNIFSGSDLILGIQPTPSFEVSEKYWGYRSVEKTIQDLRGFVPSRDFGISLKGKLSESGNVNYSLMFGNNSANSPETDKYKRYYASIDFQPVNKFVIALTGDFKSRAEVEYPNNSGEKYSHNTILGSLFLGYTEKNLYSFGVEGVFQLNQNDVIVGGNLDPEIKDVNALGISAFGSYWFSETFSALVRYDYLDPNMDELFKGDSRNFFIAGVDFKVDKNISIIPNVVVETYESLADGTSFDASVTGRVTLYYNF